MTGKSAPTGTCNAVGVCFETRRDGVSIVGVDANSSSDGVLVGRVGGVLGLELAALDELVDQRVVLGLGLGEVEDDASGNSLSVPSSRSNPRPSQDLLELVWPETPSEPGRRIRLPGNRPDLG